MRLAWQKARELPDYFHELGADREIATMQSRAPVTDQEFQTRSDAALQDLNRSLLKAAETFEFDPDFQAGALTIEFEEPREKFVVSPNAPVYQVWVSARVKSYKLDWQDAKNAFILSTSGQTLKELLGDLIGQRVGESVTL